MRRPVLPRPSLSYLAILLRRLRQVLAVLSLRAHRFGPASSRGTH